MRTRIYIIVGVIAVSFMLSLLSLFLLKPSEKEVATTPLPAAYFKEEKGSLIEDAPLIPSYPGSELIRSYKKQEDGKVGYDIYWTSNDSVIVVMSWYQKQLDNDGWLLQSPPEDILSDGEQQAIYSKDDLLLYLTVENEDGIITDIFAEFPLSR